jgi:hypothetical protein
MFAVIRHYHFDAKNGAEIDRQVREGFVPLIKKAKGFVRYYWLDTGSCRHVQRLVCMKRPTYVA